MEPTTRPQAAVITIFGAAGDLTWRKLVPALYNLFLDKWLAERFAVFGLDAKEMSQAEWCLRLRQGVDEFSRRGKADDAQWQAFAAHLSFMTADFGDAAAYARLGEQIAAQSKDWGGEANCVFYLAIPPTLIETVVGQLGQAKLSLDREHRRIVTEKPFGRDRASASALDRTLTACDLQ